MKYHLLLLALSIGCLIACEEDSIWPHPISVTDDGNDLSIRNHSSTDVYFAVIPESALPLIDWFPFISEENKISPDETRKIPLDPPNGISGALPNNEPLAIFYWEAVEMNGVLKPDSISQFTYTP